MENPGSVNQVAEELGMEYSDEVLREWERRMIEWRNKGESHENHRQ